MRIAICDDEKLAVDKLAKIVKKWIALQTCPIDLECHNSPESFLFSWGTRIIDIALLDILMKGMTGIDLSRRIRETDTHMSIIFVTNNSKLALQGFGVQVAAYLPKPVSEKECFQALDAALASHRKKSDEIFFYQGPNQALAVPKADIIYFESEGHYVKLFLHDRHVSFRMSMTQLAEQMPYPQFFRCHKSYIVNMYHVQDMQRDRVTVSNGHEVWIGRRKWDAINDAYLAARMNPDEKGNIYCVARIEDEK